MDIKDVLALVNAGFSKEEIGLMMKPVQGSTDPEPAPAAVEPEQTEPEPAPVPAAAPAPAPAAAPEGPSTADLMKEIAKLTSAIQANAIASSQIPGAALKQPGAEDMIAEIIRPTFKGRSD